MTSWLFNSTPKTQADDLWALPQHAEDRGGRPPDRVEPFLDRSTASEVPLERWSADRTERREGRGVTA
ncbi:MAG: hypothetical protein CSB49_03875 [Proteobacteria bacterium]|nr:MAG: hypothetical protein CSB49_03875 [Pseudomonadota bacterium]